MNEIGPFTFIRFYQGGWVLWITDYMAVYWRPFAIRFYGRQRWD